MSAMHAIARRRLEAQGLGGARFGTALDAVARLGAVQAQDWAGAKWALAQRVPGTTEAGVDRLFDEGAILRTHVLRPTWHAVLPQDVRWLLALTAPRVKLRTASRDRMLGVDAALLSRTHRAIADALARRGPLTRTELKAALDAAGLALASDVFSHAVIHAELDALVVSGPRRGAQHTYALLDQRAPHAVELDRDAALAELARRYFTTRGPAQIADFCWWSGLTVTDARHAVHLAGDALVHERIEGHSYWLSASAAPAPPATGIVHLLPNYDELTVAYSDRRALMPDGLVPPAFGRGGVLGPVVTVDGVVRGEWKPRRRGNCVDVEVLMPEGTPRTVLRGVQRQLSEFERFSGSAACARRRGRAR